MTHETKPHPHKHSTNRQSDTGGLNSQAPPGTIHTSLFHTSRHAQDRRILRNRQLRFTSPEAGNRKRFRFPIPVSRGGAHGK
jgi:hypothetical protein